MKRVSLEGAGRLELQHVAEPALPGPGQALVRVRRVGICGTDLHAFAGDQPFVRYPVVLGHELAVEVIELGAADRGSTAQGHGLSHALRVGDRCTVIPYISDGRCPACRAGKPNCCAALEVLGVHRDGGLQELLVLPQAQLVPANDLDDDVLALVEMLAVGAHAARRAAIEDRETVLVLGAGPIGLSVMAFARACARRVLALDIDPYRSAFAGKAGLASPVDIASVDAAAAAAAGAATDAPRTASQPLEAALRERLDGALPDVVIDATGNPGSMERAVTLAEHGGRVVYVGHTAGTIRFDNPTLHRRELTLVFSRNALPVDFEEVLAAVRSGAVDVREWITARTDLTRIAVDLPRWHATGAGIIKAAASVSPEHDRDMGGDGSTYARERA